MRLSRPSDPALRGVLLAMGAVFGTLAARIPAVRETAGLGEAALGAALLALMLGAVLGLLPGALLVNRLGARRVLAIAWLVFVTSLVLTPFAAGLPLLAGLLFTLGAANSVLDVAINDRATRIEAERARPMLAGFHAMHTVGTLAGAGLAVVAGALAVGAPAHFLLAGAILLPLGLLGAISLEPDGRSDSRAAGFQLPHRSLLTPAFIALAAIFIDDVGNTWSAVYLDLVSGATQGVASAGFGALTLGGLCGRLVADRIIGRVGRRDFVVGAGLVAAAGGGLIVLLPGPAPSLLGFGLVGLGAGPILPAVLSQAAAQNPDRRTEAIAGVTTIGYLGSLIGPFSVGLLSAGVGLRMAMLVIPLLAITACALAVGLPGRKG
ncbi:MAG: MFS transporter [Chloroflexota bacterium]|nr:MFS transporter [Chloroflexota bacterium]